MRIIYFAKFYFRILLGNLYFPIGLSALGILIRFNAGDRRFVDLVLGPSVSAIVAYLAVFFIVSIGIYLWYTRLVADIRDFNNKACNSDDLKIVNEMIINRMRRDKV